MQLKEVSLDTINSVSKNTLMEHLKIKITEIGKDYIKGTMPVNITTHQPMGLLHGGASVALIESLGSVGSSLLLDLNEKFPVGLEVNANHVGAIRSGKVEGHARLIHGGKTTHVWSVEVRDLESKRLISTGRLTVMVVDKKSKVG